MVTVLAGIALFACVAAIAAVLGASHGGERTLVMPEGGIGVGAVRGGGGAIDTGANDDRYIKKGGPTHRPLSGGHRVGVEEHDLPDGAALVARSGEGVNGEALPPWTGTQCIGGGLLTDKKLLSNCRKGRVERQWCDRIAAAHSSAEPLCGQYAAGVFGVGTSSSGNANSATNNKSVVSALSPNALEAVRRSLVEGIAAQKVTAHQCNTPRTFGGVVERGTVAFSEVAPSSDSLSNSNRHDKGPSTANGQRIVLASRLCPSFSYIPLGAPVASVLHYHAAVAGRPFCRRGILFTGDSMMRQLMLHLISAVRDGGGGMRRSSSASASPSLSDDRGSPMDHYFHTDALYVVRRGGSDALIVLDSAASKTEPFAARTLRRWFPGYLDEPIASEDSFGDDGVGEDDDVLFAILYLWDIMPSTHRKEPFRMPRLALHIGAFMYWWNNKGQLAELEPYLAAMTSHLAANPQQAFIHVTAPATKEGTFGGVLDSIRIPRNRRMALFVDEEDHARHQQQQQQQKNAGGEGHGAAAEAAHLGRRQRWLLDFSGIADANNVAPSDGGGASSSPLISKTADGIHYGCIWLPKYPETVKGMKDNGMGCKDPMNAAVSQWLLALLLRM